MTNVSTSSSGSSSSSPGAHLVFTSLVNKKLACTCHLAVVLLEFKGQHRVPFTRQPRNVLQKCQTHLICGAGCIFSAFLGSEETHTHSDLARVAKEFVQMLFSSLQLSFCGIIPAKIILEFHICARQPLPVWTFGEPQKCLHFLKMDVLYFERLFLLQAGRNDWTVFSSFPATIFFQSMPQQERSFLLIMLKPHPQITVQVIPLWARRAGTYWQPLKIKTPCN